MRKRMTERKKSGLAFLLLASACNFAFVPCSPAAGPALVIPGAAEQLYIFSAEKTAAPEAAAPVPGEVARSSSRGPAGGYNALIWTPAITDDWYEWWYYKVVVPGTDDAFYFCYGVVNPWDLDLTKPASRSYVSAGSFADKETAEQTFKPGDFSASSESTFVRIGGNQATDRALKGSLPAPGGGEISWDLTVEKDWGVNLMAWTMSQGWLSNIYWYPAQASARMSGTIKYRGRIISLNGAPAYQDRNWGRSFPKWWTWLVSNNFKNSPGTVLASGGGQPKIYPGVEPIQTVTIGLRHEGKEYLFRPTMGDIVTVDVNFGKWEVNARNKWGERMQISAYAPREKFLLLQFMTPQGKMYNDYEALKGNIKVKLYKGAKLLADLETAEGGIEFGSFASFDPKPNSGTSGEVSFDGLFSGENHLQ